jgi:hypothetical protein
VLHRELREKREQLEHLMKKNVFRYRCGHGISASFWLSGVTGGFLMFSVLDP